MRVTSFLKALSQSLIPGMLVCSIGLNLMLTLQLRTARQATLIEPAGLPIGTLLPAIHVKSEDGRKYALSWAGSQATLLYVFDPHCGWCKRNAAPFREMASKIEGKIRVYSFSSRLDGMADFKDHAQHPVLVLTDDQEDVRRLLKITGTPTTLLVDSTGRLVKSWEGAYMGAIHKDIQDYFHVNLPEARN